MIGEKTFVADIHFFMLSKRFRGVNFFICLRACHKFKNNQTFYSALFCNFVFSGLRDEFLRFVYAYGIMALVSMVAVSYGLFQTELFQMPCLLLCSGAPS